MSLRRIKLLGLAALVIGAIITQPLDQPALSPKQSTTMLSSVDSSSSVDRTGLRDQP